MTLSGVIHILVYFGVILLLTKPLGAYMAAVFEGNGRMSTRFFAPVEHVVYRAFFVDAMTRVSRSSCCPVRILQDSCRWGQ